MLSPFFFDATACLSVLAWTLFPLQILLLPPFQGANEISALIETNFPFNDYDIYVVVPQAARSREGGAT